MSRNLISECSFNASRSSGPGGQNVNKVNTRIELRFPLASSIKLSATEKERITEKLSSRINREGELILTSSDQRNQLQNKEAVIQRFYELLEFALHVPKKRISTKPGRVAHLKRLENKRKLALKKELRRKDW